MRNELTVLMLTFNEAPNIGRSLSALSWAPRVVVVDSGSVDDTVAIAKQFPNVEVVNRAFDSHASQWNFALAQANSNWVLALDADYCLSHELVQELKQLIPDAAVAGYQAKFNYAIEGEITRASIYPPVTVLFRRNSACYEQSGHTQRLRLNGALGYLVHPIVHDDRKPESAWRHAQFRYARLEAMRISQCRWKDLRWSDRLRSLHVITPIAVPAYCLLIRGGCLDGKVGWKYASQRGYAEWAISAALLRQRLGRSG